MYKSKRFEYTYTDYEEDNKNAETMIGEIMDDPEFPELEEIIQPFHLNASVI